MVSGELNYLELEGAPKNLGGILTLRLEEGRVDVVDPAIIDPALKPPSSTAPPAGLQRSPLTPLSGGLDNGEIQIEDPVLVTPIPSYRQIARKAGLCCDAVAAGHPPR